MLVLVLVLASDLERVYAGILYIFYNTIYHNTPPYPLSTFCPSPYRTLTRKPSSSKDPKA